MKTWLLLDCNYLAYRAFFAMGNLRFKNAHTGVIYGFMRDLRVLMDSHNTRRVCFCFDHGKPKRTELWPEYKAGRHDNLTDLEQDLRIEMKRQVSALRKTHLTEIGFQNVFYEKGYEADDLIASIVQNLSKKDEAIIVSSDKDLYQLLSDRVMIWNASKGKMFTVDLFRKEFGIEPTAWPDVKSMSGCTTDNVPGIKGVGEKTAAKFLRGELKADSKVYREIVRQNKTWKENDKLVRLPFPGTPTFELRRDDISQYKWDAVANQYGMNSLLGASGGQKKKKANQIGKGFGIRKNSKS